MEKFTKRVKERIRDEARLDNCKPDLPTTLISTSKRDRIRLDAPYFSHSVVQTLGPTI